MQLYIGLMSGTSMDAIDAALVDFSATSLQILAYRQTPLSDSVRELLGTIAGESAAALTSVARADVLLGREFAAAANSLLADADIAAADVVALGSHGQTVFHHADTVDPFTVQLGDPNLIATLTGIRTVADFRRKDLAVGGEGAPLAPVLHEHLFGDTQHDRGILNIGGIANLTILPGDGRSPTRGFDTGPGNALLDDWSQRHLRQRFDKDGKWAEGGTTSSVLLSLLLDDPYVAREPPKSTGREYYNLEWLDSVLAKHATAVDPQDVQATLVGFTCESVARQINIHVAGCKELLVCGGGVHNPTLMRGLGERLPALTVESTAAYGLDPDAVEAVRLCLVGQTQIGQVTGQPAIGYRRLKRRRFRRGLRTTVNRDLDVGS